MTTLTRYDQFNGRHWETGSVHNFFAQRGFTAPHTGAPYSEAVLFGITGGVTFGYFTFFYEGYPPQCNILTRNTFDPLDKMLSRLGVVQEIKRTSSADRAVRNLVDVLDDGQPAIVWADMWGLPYNALPFDEGMWGSFPIVVHGYDAEADRVLIADRAGVSLQINTADLATARGRIKKDKFRLMTLEAPNPDKLASAVQLGLTDTIQLFLEKPPKGSAKNFGLTGLQNWIDMLNKPKQRKSWEKLFPAGFPLYAGLTSAYEFSALFGKGEEEDAERGLFASFLQEAAVLLNRPSLNETADLYREAARCWQQLPAKLLPEAHPLLGESRHLMQQKHRAFLQRGGGALDEIQGINERLDALREQAKADFPLSEAEVIALREGVAEQLADILDAEKAAVLHLQQSML